MKAPIFTTEYHGKTQCRFFCPFCDEWHYHGRLDDAFGEHRHRVAHCHRASSPLRETGYYLRTFQEECDARKATS